VRLVPVEAIEVLLKQKDPLVIDEDRTDISISAIDNAIDKPLRDIEEKRCRSGFAYRNAIR
jgi:hypothetical protein